MLPALALERRRRRRVTRRPPRSPKERLLSWPLLARAYLWLGFLEAAAAMTAFLRAACRGWNYGEMLPANDPIYLQATTACLSAIIVMQVGQRISLPQRARFDIYPRAFSQSPDPDRRRGRNRADSINRLHALGKPAVRHGADIHKRMALCRAIRARHAAARRITQSISTALIGNAAARACRSMADLMVGCSRLSYR